MVGTAWETLCVIAHVACYLDGYIRLIELVVNDKKPKTLPH